MPELVGQILQVVIVPIVIGIITSWLFLLMQRIPPNIQISPNIAKFKSKKHAGYGYIVKILNKSKWAAVDINVRFATMQSKIVPDGPIMRTSDFKLEKDSEFEIPGFDESDPEASAFRFITYEDIETKWDDDKNFVIFVVYAKNSLTGFGKVFKQRYYLKRDAIRDGTFKKGKSMEIA
ncbi:MAG: hypothetical protein JW963_09695 [Anaerolineales bacterium]|nr:hypothetical protein [Anaerolineales bacterium]